MLQKTKLKVEPISTQVIPRDRHAYFFNIRDYSKFNREICYRTRHLQRTEVLEVEEFFEKNKRVFGNAS